MSTTTCFCGKIRKISILWIEKSALTRAIPIIQTLELLGPVVQSVVSLTSSLRVISLTVLAESKYNILIFFAEKM